MVYKDDIHNDVGHSVQAMKVTGKWYPCVFQVLATSWIKPGDKFGLVLSSSSKVSISLYFFSLLIDFDPFLMSLLGP